MIQRNYRTELFCFDGYSLPYQMSSSNWFFKIMTFQNITLHVKREYFSIKPRNISRVYDYGETPGIL
jgi:hypothetical protein